MAATLSVTLKMIDQMSSQLDAVANNVEKLINKFESLETNANSALERASSGVDKFNDAMKTMEDQGSKAKDALENQVSAADKVVGGYEDIADEAENAARQSEEFGTKGAQSAMNVSAALAAAGIVVALEKIAAAYMAVDDAADAFETSMAKVNTIADTSAVDLGTIEEDIVKLSQETGQSVNDIADSVYNAISASVDTAEAVGFVAQANALAVGGFTDTTSAVDALTTAINAYGLEADDAEEVADRLIQTQNLGKTTVDELASSLGNVIPTAAAFNTDLDNLMTAYAILTQNGVNTANATTMLNSMLTELADSGSTVATVLEEETGQSFSELMASGYDLGDVLAILGGSVDDDSTAFVNLWGNIRAGKGAVTLFNAGAEEFEQTLDQMGDSAGAAEQAFQKMTSTGEFVEKRWETSLDNLKIAIGKAVPQLDGLMSKGTDIVDKLTEFVDKHPEVIGAISAIVATVGTFVAAIIGIEAAVKISQTAWDAFMIILEANPIMIAVTAVAALTAGLVLLDNALSDSWDNSDKLTGASQRLADQITDQEDYVKECAKKWGDYDDRTLTAKNNLIDLKDEFEKSAKTIGELDDEINYVINSLDEFNRSYSDSMKAIDDDSESALLLINRMQTIESLEDKTAAQREVEAQMVNKLNDLYPDLGLQYDEVTDKLNKSTEALKEYVKQQVETARQQQDVEAYTEALIKQAEAQDALNEVITEAADANAKYQELRNHLMAVGMDENSREDMNAIANAMNEAGVYLDEVQGKVETVSEAYHEWTDIVADLEAKLNITSQSASKVAGAVEDAMDPVAALQEGMAGVFASVEDQAVALMNAYDQARQAAESAVESSFGLFEKISLETETTTQDMIDALESQAKYLEQYSENLNRANEIGLEPKLVESLADGSQQSAAQLQAIMDQIDELGGKGKDVEEFVAKMNDSFNKVEEAKKTLEDTMVQMNEDLQAGLDDLKEKMETGVKELNLSKEAGDAAQKTMEAYIEALQSGGEQAVSAAESIKRSVESILSSISMPKISGVGSVSTGLAAHASGTMYGEDVYIAGERGPELIVGRRGSEVFPASETARILNAVMDMRKDLLPPAPSIVPDQTAQDDGSSITHNSQQTLDININGKGDFKIGGLTMEKVTQHVTANMEHWLLDMMAREFQEEGSFAYEF